MRLSAIRMKRHTRGQVRRGFVFVFFFKSKQSSGTLSVGFWPAESELVNLKIKLLRSKSQFSFCFFFLSTVCQASVTVEVAPTVEVVKGESAQLPCKYTISPPVSNTIVEWYIVSPSEIYLLKCNSDFKNNSVAMKHSPFSSCAERGARNQDARSFPTPWRTGQK